MKQYTYRVKWSYKDNEYVATCDEFPSLSWLDKSTVEAIKGIKRIVTDVTNDSVNTISGLPEPTDRTKQLENALREMLSWSYGGRCSDCDMFREAPSCIDFIHEKDCGHLESINAALVLLDREPDEGHDLEDPKAEMQRLADERTAECRRRGLIK